MLIGSAVAHRNRSELEGLIGFLVNMLALRTDLSGNPGFDELLKRVRTTTIGAWSHQDLPLTQILAQVQPGRDLGRNPLFQVQFSLLTPDRNPAVYGYGLEMGQIETIELPGLVMSPVEVKFDNARYDIAIFLWDMPEGIEGTLEYSRDLYEPATMERFVERYKTLLNCVLANPRIRLQELVLSLQESDSTAEQEAADNLKASTQAKLKGLRKRSGRRSRSHPEDLS
jgi:non-ribosomal peptide synthetase component F